MHSSSTSIRPRALAPYFLRPMHQLRTDPTSIPDLQAFLLRAGCVAVQVHTDTMEVYAPDTSGSGSERSVLLALLHEWGKTHRVDVELAD